MLHMNLIWIGITLHYVTSFIILSFSIMFMKNVATIVIIIIYYVMISPAGKIGVD